MCRATARRRRRTSRPCCNWVVAATAAEIRGADADPYGPPRPEAELLAAAGIRHICCRAGAVLSEIADPHLLLAGAWSLTEPCPSAERREPDSTPTPPAWMETERRASVTVTQCLSVLPSNSSVRPRSTSSTSDFMGGAAADAQGGAVLR